MLNRARWVVAVLLTGLAAGLGGLSLALLLHVIQHVAFGYSLDKLVGAQSFLQGVSMASSGRRVAVLAVCGVMAGCGWLAVNRLGTPLVSIAKAVKLNDPALPVRSTFAHALLQIVTVALGSPLGREVAPREIGATIAGVMASKAGFSVDQRRILVACGAGAGLAAVYNVPLGGALFVLEGLLGSFGWEAAAPALVTSVIAALVARVGLGDVTQYTVPHLDVTGSLLAWSVVMGPLVGSAAYWFTRLTSSARVHAERGWWLPVFCVLNFVGIGLLATRFPQLLGNGKGPVQLSFDNGIGVQLAAGLLMLRTVITLTSLRAGAHGGLLTPGLCCGALLAVVAGGIWTLYWPGTALAAFAVVGAAAFLAISMRIPITAVVLIFEFTHVGLPFLVPIVLALAGALMASNRWPRWIEAYAGVAKLNS